VISSLQITTDVFILIEIDLLNAVLFLNAAALPGCRQRLNRLNIEQESNLYTGRTKGLMTSFELSKEFSQQRNSRASLIRKPPCRSHEARQYVDGKKMAKL
jgi:hypothetical protein